MIRALRAMSWLRWRLLLNTIRGGRRRDAVEQVSRILALMVPIIFGTLFIGSILTATFFGFIGGLAVTDHTLAPNIVVFIARVGVAVLCVVVALLATGAPGQTTLSRYTRLLVMPIPRQALHIAEVAASLADPWQVLIAAGLLAFAAGLLAGGALATAVVALVGALLVLAVLASLSASLSFLVAWLFRSRRRGELFTLVFVMGISAVSLLPAFFSDELEGRSRAGNQSGPRKSFSVDEFDRSLPAWTHALPSEAYGRAMNEAINRNPAGVAAGLGILAANAVLLFAFSSAVHRRVIQSLEGDHRRRRNREITVTAPRLPFIGAAASAVAWAQYRTAIRSVRGRLIVLLPGPMLAMMTVIFRQLPGEEGQWGSAATEHGYLLLSAGVIFCFYSLQAFSMNMFGSDRSGLTLQLLAPVSDRHLAWGKLYGCGLILGASVLVAFGACLAVSPSGSPYYWTAVLLAGLAMYLSLSPIALWLSALFPVASDLSKTGSGGNPHPLPMFAGTFLVLLAALPNALIIFLAAVWWKRPVAALAGVGLWTIVIAAVAIPLVNLTSRSVGQRRENLALIAQGK